jgi:hypothetical protein
MSFEIDSDLFYCFFKKCYIVQILVKFFFRPYDFIHHKNQTHILISGL